MTLLSQLFLNLLCSKPPLKSRLNLFSTLSRNRWPCIRICLLLSLPRYLYVLRNLSLLPQEKDYICQSKHVPLKYLWNAFLTDDEVLSFPHNYQMQIHECYNNLLPSSTRDLMLLYLEFYDSSLHILYSRLKAWFHWDNQWIEYYWFQVITLISLDTGHPQFEDLNFVGLNLRTILTIIQE